MDCPASVSSDIIAHGTWYCSDSNNLARIVTTTYPVCNNQTGSYVSTSVNTTEYQACGVSSSCSNGNCVLSQNLSVCGNGLCESGESSSNCCVDCPSSTGSDGVAYGSWFCVDSFNKARLVTTTTSVCNNQTKTYGYVTTNTTETQVCSSGAYCSGGNCIVNQTSPPATNVTLPKNDFYWNIDWIDLNSATSGWEDSLTVSAGQTVSGKFSYTIWNAPVCGSSHTSCDCIDEIVLGLEGDPKSCWGVGVPQCYPGKNGEASFSFTAPATPGTYNLYYTAAQAYTCDVANDVYRTSSGRKTAGKIVVSGSNASCTDSDGGGNFDYYIKGTTTGPVAGGAIHTETDSCGGDSVYEYGCNPAPPYNFFATSYQCPNGCSNGACIQKVSCGNGFCEYGETASSCSQDCTLNFRIEDISGPSSVSPGSYPTFKVKAVGNNGLPAKMEDGYNLRYYLYNCGANSCPAAGTANYPILDEGFAGYANPTSEWSLYFDAPSTSGNYFADVSLFCSGIAACKAEPDKTYTKRLYFTVGSATPSCTDSDGGVDIYNKGILYYTGVKYEDYCIQIAAPAASASTSTGISYKSGDVSVSVPQHVLEYSCGAGGVITGDYVCAQGCFDGACKQQTTDLLELSLATDKGSYSVGDLVRLSAKTYSAGNSVNADLKSYVVRPDGVRDELIFATEACAQPSCPPGTGAAVIPASTSPPETTSNSDKPDVKIFVMAFSPYGKQAEQGLGPAALSLGVDVEPHFVIYPNYLGGGPDFCIESGKYCSMHGVAELNEGIRQLCIYKEYKEKWWTYVDYVNSKCSLQNIDSCWKDAANSAGIGTSAVESCQKKDGVSLAKSEYELNQKLGVQSAPTIFINGQQYQGGRSTEEFRSALVPPSKTPPETCAQPSCPPGTLCRVAPCATLIGVKNAVYKPAQDGAYTVSVVASSGSSSTESSVKFWVDRQNVKDKGQPAPTVPASAFKVLAGDETSFGSYTVKLTTVQFGVQTGTSNVAYFDVTSSDGRTTSKAISVGSEETIAGLKVRVYDAGRIVSPVDTAFAVISLSSTVGSMPIVVPARPVAVCGDGVVSAGENQNNCCVDTGCAGKAVCSKALNKCVKPVKEISQETILEVLMGLEDVRIKLDTLEAKALIISKYYSSKDQPKSDSWANAAKVFASAKLQVDAITVDLKGNRNKIDEAAIDSIRQKLDVVRGSLKEAVDILLGVPVFSNDFDLSKLVASYNSNLDKVPSFVKSIIGNERINAHISLSNGSELVIGGLADNGKIVELREGGIENATLEIFASEYAIRELKTSKDRAAALQSALDSKRISYKSTSAVTEAKLSIASRAYNLVSRVWG